MIMPTELQLMELRLRSLEKSQGNQNESIDALHRAIGKLDPDLMSQVNREMVDEWNKEHGFPMEGDIAHDDPDKD